MGDVNRDGLADFAIGAYGNDYGGTSARQTYVVFGQSSFGSGRWTSRMSGAPWQGFPPRVPQRETARVVPTSVATDSPTC